LVFRGEILVDEWETIDGDFRGHPQTRLVHSVLPFYITFPKTVSTSTTVRVYSPVSNLAAIIKQVTARGVQAVTSATANIDLYTNVQYPFKLVEPSIFANNRHDLTPQHITPPAVFCADVASQACANEWNIDMTAPVSPPICNYTGDWTIHFMAICQPSLGDDHCPLPQNPITNRRELMVEVIYHLTSEDFCPKIIADIPVSATLKSYQQILPSLIPKNDFLIGARTLWIAEASSSAATIVEVSLNNVYSRDSASADTTLFPGGSAALAFAHTDYLRSTGTVPGISDFPKRSDFAFTLAATVFNVDADLSATFTIGCKLNVVFQNTDPTGAPTVRTYDIILPYKPLVMPGAETSDSEVSATSDVSLRGPTTSHPSGLGAAAGLSQTAVIGIIAGGASLLLLLAAIIIVVVRRRRAAKVTQPAVSVALEGVIATGGGSSQP